MAAWDKKSLNMHEIYAGKFNSYPICVYSRLTSSLDSFAVFSSKRINKIP